MLDACLYDGLRTPFGRHAGVLAPVRPDDLAAHVIRALIERSPFLPERFEDVLLGNTCQAGEDSRNVARHAALLAGFPPSVPGQTINRLCASGLSAVVDAARAIALGEGQLFIAGGVESMSRAPYVFGKSDSAYGRDLRLFDSTIGSRFPNVELVARYGNHSMPETADNVAIELGISREQADTFAAASQTRYAAAQASGFFAGELLAVPVPRGRKQAPLLVSEDEHPRPESTRDALARLKPLFEGGVTTAGNASGINDGAAAVVLGSRVVGEQAGIQPLARILSTAVAGIEPRIMGLGPVEAIRKAVIRAGLQLPDMDLIEINEAFAAQVLGCLKQLGIGFDDERVNPNGGAIALGHPLGASGARLVLTAARELHRRGARYAVVSLCIGVGQGQALVLERL